MWPMAGDESLSEGEEFVVRLHPHWKILLRPLFILAVLFIAVIAVLLLLPVRSNMNAVRIGVGAVAVVLALVWVAVPVMRWKTTTYELTTRRLRLREGILSRSGRDFPLNRISDVSFSQDLLDRMFGCGRLIVESPGEMGRLVLTEIPDVRRVQAVLFQLVGDEEGRLGRVGQPD